MFPDSLWTLCGKVDSLWEIQISNFLHPPTKSEHKNTYLHYLQYRSIHTSNPGSNYPSKNVFLYNNNNNNYKVHQRFSTSINVLPFLLWKKIWVSVSPGVTMEIHPFSNNWDRPHGHGLCLWLRRTRDGLSFTKWWNDTQNWKQVFLVIKKNGDLLNFQFLKTWYFSRLPSFARIFVGENQKNWLLVVGRALFQKTKFGKGENLRQQISQLSYQPLSEKSSHLWCCLWPWMLLEPPKKILIHPWFNTDAKPNMTMTKQNQLERIDGESSSPQISCHIHQSAAGRKQQNKQTRARCIFTRCIQKKCRQGKSLALRFMCKLIPATSQTARQSVVKTINHEPTQRLNSNIATTLSTHVI